MIFFDDDQLLDLPPKIAAEEEGLDKEQATLTDLIARGVQATKTSETADAELKQKRDGMAELEATAQTQDAEIQEFCRNSYVEALSTTSACDIDGLAQAIERRRSRVQFLRNAIEFGRRYEIPLLHLKRLSADANMMALHCSISSQRALISAVERYQISQPLLEAEHTVTFSPGAGKTGALIEAARDAFKLARAAAEAVENERSRQSGLGVGIAFERVK